MMMMMSFELLADQASAALSGGGDCYPTPPPRPQAVHAERSLSFLRYPEDLHP